MNSLYILDISPLADTWFAFFSHSIHCLITPLIISSAVQKLCLMQTYLSIFAFVLYAKNHSQDQIKKLFLCIFFFTFVSYEKNHCQDQHQEDFPCIFFILCYPEIRKYDGSSRFFLLKLALAINGPL